MEEDRRSVTPVPHARANKSPTAEPAAPTADPAGPTAGPSTSTAPPSDGTFVTFAQLREAERRIRGLIDSHRNLASVSDIERLQQQMIDLDEKINLLAAQMEISLNLSEREEAPQPPERKTKRKTATKGKTK